MKVLIVLTYYRPHVSGLTIYVERLARALAARDHQVTVLTSQYDRDLPLREVRHGVSIRRVPVAFRVSKGVVMPTIGWQATRALLNHDVVSLHLPQLDAAGIALRGRILRRPTVLTYHSDLRLPPGFVNRAANTVVDIANRLAASFAHRIIAYTEDFATHSPYLSRYLDKVTVIKPPVEVAVVSGEDVQAFSKRYAGPGPNIGMAARLASEKGVEVLLEALPQILETHPQARILFAGPYQNVLGEEDYARMLAPLLERYKESWTFLGTLEPSEMAAFYRNCAVTVLPSLNNTETFGLVQIESMICGTPVVASDLPGVRQPVRMTGMGEIIPIGDSQALATAILRVIDRPHEYRADPQEIAARFSPHATAEAYERVFHNVSAEMGRPAEDR